MFLVYVVALATVKSSPCCQRFILADSTVRTDPAIEMKICMQHLLCFCVVVFFCLRVVKSGSWFPMVYFIVFIVGLARLSPRSQILHCDPLTSTFEVVQAYIPSYSHFSGN